MEILDLILGSLFLCGTLALISYLTKDSEEYSKYIREMYEWERHEFHN